MDLIIKNKSVPIKAIPEQELNKIILTQFLPYIANLLSLTGETSAERLKVALPAIKQHCWSMGFDEIQKMFEMYVDGKLSVQPKSNYFDRVLLGQIFQAYKSQSRTKPEAKDIDKEKKEKDYFDCVNWFEWFKEHRRVTDEMTWLYYYLEHLIDASPKEKRTLYNLGKEQKLSDEDAKKKAKLVLLRRYFERLEAKDKHIKDVL